MRVPLTLASALLAGALLASGARAAQAPTDDDSTGWVGQRLVNRLFGGILGGNQAPSPQPKPAPQPVAQPDLQPAPQPAPVPLSAPDPAPAPRSVARDGGLAEPPVAAAKLSGVEDRGDPRGDRGGLGLPRSAADAANAAEAADLGAAASRPGRSGAAARSLSLESAIGQIGRLPEKQTQTQAQRQALQLAWQAKRQLSAADYSGALASATSALRLDPDSEESWLKRAQAANKLRLYDEALAAAQEAARLAPRNPAAWRQAAWALFAQRRYRDAADAAAKAIADNPNDAVSYAIRARARWALGDKAGALADAATAAKLDARFTDLLDAARSGDDLLGEDPSTTGDDAADVRVGASGGLPAWPLALGTLLTAGLGALGAWLLAGRRRRATTARGVAARDLRERDGSLLDGKYELRALIGRGGMGDVYEAFDHSLQRLVAIKQLSAGLADTEPKARALILAEAVSVASLHHPNIVAIHEIVERGPDVYLVFELVRGKTLSQVLAENGAPLPLAEVLRLLQPVCDALQAAHARDLVHRDLKPANVMVTEDGFVKLMDFGIARSMGTPVQRSTDAAGSAAELPMLARTRTIRGTPYYMAPEMERGVVCKESDVYALGVTVYELLTGRFPFETTEQKLAGAFAPASALAPGLPAGVDEALARALEPDPERRLRGAAQLFGALRSAARGLTPPAAVAEAGGAR